MKNLLILSFLTLSGAYSLASTGSQSGYVQSTFDNFSRDVGIFSQSLGQSPGCHFIGKNTGAGLKLALSSDKNGARITLPLSAEVLVKESPVVQDAFSRSYYVNGDVKIVFIHAGYQNYNSVSITKGGVRVGCESK